MKLGFDFGSPKESDLGNRKVKVMQAKLRKGWWNNPVRYFLVLLVLSLALSYVYVLRLGEGGEVTFMSMLALSLIGYIVHPAAGLAAAFLYAVLRYCFDYILPGYADTVLREFGGGGANYQTLLHMLDLHGYRAMRESLKLSLTVDRVQVVGDLFDYLIGYTLIGLLGFVGSLTVKKDKDSAPRRIFTLRSAYLAVVILRYIESVINYLVFYPEPTGFFRQLWDAMFYSFLYVMVEGLLTLAILSIPPVMNTILFVRTVARSDFDERIYRES